jgi:hypothetical protein
MNKVRVMDEIPVKCEVVFFEKAIQVLERKSDNRQDTGLCGEKYAFSNRFHCEMPIENNVLMMLFWQMSSFKEFGIEYPEFSHSPMPG